MITAPEVTEDTEISDTFGLVQEGVTWFGPEDVTLTVVVHPRETAPDSDPDAGMDLPPPPTTDTGDPPPATDPPISEGTPSDGTGGITGGCAAAGAPAPTSWAWYLGVVTLLATRRRRRR
jgi:MYXO-CTERM domain-containing protein